MRPTRDPARSDARDRTVPLAWALLLGMGLWSASCSEDARPAPSGAERSPNVLFIIADDLRPELGCYGVEHVRTPRMDSLAAQGVLFARAYSQQAICSPSRSTVLTGVRPDTHGVLFNHSHYRQKMPDVVVLPQLFTAGGYRAFSVGKIQHGGAGQQDPGEWGSEPWYPAADAFETPMKTLGKLWYRKVSHFDGPQPYLPPDVDDEGLRDGLAVRRAIELMEEHRDGPFFLAVGFSATHLPFLSPRAYHERYEVEDIPLSAPREAPSGAPAHVNLRTGQQNLPQVERWMAHSYVASVSYIDALVGQLLDALERLELADHTIVVVTSDHGFHLGEQGVWGKSTIFELGLRVPLILRVPGVGSGGTPSDALVELVDLYPTLAELCGLEPPHPLEGTSLVPLLEDPARPWKSAVFAQAHRPGDIVGRTIRTERYRYTEWDTGAGAAPELELYDLGERDIELDNLAATPQQRAEHEELIEELREQLHAGWRAALPE